MTVAQSAALLAELARWSEQGWLRRLDHAFARFVVELWPQAPAPVVLAAALLAHVEGRGHSCLPIDRLLADSAGLPGLAPAAAEALQRLLRDLPHAAADWLDALRISPLVRVDDGRPADADALARPLVLNGSRLYLRRYWHCEQVVAAQVARRASRWLEFDRGAARGLLDRLFRAPEPRRDDVEADTPFDWQKAACGLALAGTLSVITGGPGTGKTYTAARLLALLFAVDPAPERLRIALAAPTGKAAARLRQSITDALLPLQRELGGELPMLADLADRIGPARTLHSLLGARPDTRRFAHDAAHPLEIDVLIVDEASMIHLEMMAALFDALPADARLILLGDKDQLASVEAGAVLGDLCADAEQGRYRPATAALLTELTGADLPERFIDRQGPALAQHTVMLRSSRRFGGAIGRLAQAVNRGDAAAAEALLQSPPDASLRWIDAAGIAPLVRLAAPPAGSRSAAGSGSHGYRDYLTALKQRPPADADPASFDAWVLSVLKAFERFRVLCAVREGEWGAVALNRAIEAALLADAAAGAGSSRSSGGWYEGRPIMVTRNDAALGVFNGDIGIALRPQALPPPSSSADPSASPLAASTAASMPAAAAGSSRQPGLRAWFADGETGSSTGGVKRPRSVAITRLAHVETAFAMTVHKAQGSEFDHCALVLPQAPSRVLTRELVYTGITRARSAFTLVTGRRAALREALAMRTVRASGLGERVEGEGRETATTPEAQRDG